MSNPFKDMLQYDWSTENKFSLAPKLYRYNSPFSPCNYVLWKSAVQNIDEKNYLMNNSQINLKR